MALTKITTSVIAANTLGTANIADNSIDATKIAANSILTRHIDDDQITGDQLADDITIAGNLTITGNLTTNGASVTNSSTNTTIEDAIIELGTGTSGAPATDAGIVIERGSSDNVFIGWDESADKVTVGTGSFTGASTGNLTITAAPFVSGALTASGISYPTSDGTNGQVLKTDGSGSLTFGDNTTKVDNYTATGDGSTTAFDTGINPGSEVNTWIFIDGVYQQKSEYSYSGSTVTFTTAPQNGASIDVITGTSSNITASDTVLGIYEATTTNTAAYTTGISASNENNTWVFVGGVYQPKDSYTFSSGTLTFDANTPTGQKLSVVATKTITAGAVDTSTLAANAVTSAKIASNSILSRHIANNSIVGADISATTQITASTFTGALTGNVTGNVAGNLTGTIQTAAQTNITSVGTLSALTVSGQLTAGGLSYPTSDGTNEQVLRTDGSGNLSFGTISGTTLNNNTNNYVMTGTGTANTLNGEANLTFDSSLVITKSEGAANSLNDQISLEHTSGTTGYHIKTIRAAATDNPDGIAFVESTTERMRIRDKNVGIGTTALTSSGGYSTLSLNGSTGGQISFQTGESAKQFIYSTSTDLNIYNNVAGNLKFFTSGTERMRIASNGDIQLMGGNQMTNALSWYNTTTYELASIENVSHSSYNDSGGLLFKTAGLSNSGMAERMRIDSSGNVGIGQASDGDKLHVLGTGFFEDSRGNGVGVQINGGSSSEFAHIGVSASNPLTFQTADTERMRLHGGGDLTVATTTAIGSMYNGVSGIGFGYSSGGYGACVRGGTNTPFYVSTNSQGAGGFIEFAQNGATRGNITYTGSATSYNASSDYRLKENAAPIQNALSKIDSLNPINFDWIESGDNSDGFLAHEIQAVLPYTVTGTKDEVYTDENSGEEKTNGQPKYQVMDYAKLTPLLVKAVQEQQTIIDDLKSRIETLEG